MLSRSTAKYLSTSSLRIFSLVRPEAIFLFFLDVVDSMKENKPVLAISFFSESDELLFSLWSELKGLSQLSTSMAAFLFRSSFVDCIEASFSKVLSSSVCNQSALNRGSKNRRSKIFLIEIRVQLQVDLIK